MVVLGSLYLMALSNKITTNSTKFCLSPNTAISDAKLAIVMSLASAEAKTWLIASGIIFSREIDSIGNVLPSLQKCIIC